MLYFPGASSRNTILGRFWNTLIELSLFFIQEYEAEEYVVLLLQSCFIYSKRKEWLFV